MPKYRPGGAIPKPVSYTHLDVYKRQVVDICRAEYKFDGFLEVMDYFKKLIKLCKQMNYAEFKSEKFEDDRRQIREMVAERQ